MNPLQEKRCEATSTQASSHRSDAFCLAILDEDPELAAHETHLRYRWEHFQNTLQDIERNEGGLLQFALSFENYGLIFKNSCTVYREWAPGAVDAQMIGEFNNWNGTHMQKDKSGVWTCTIPNVDLEAAVRHLSKYKIRLRQKNGRWTDVLSAWTRYAIQNKARMDGAFDAVCWNPPIPYIWQHNRPPRPNALCIYEAHVGMSSEEPIVASYLHFADEVVPHIVRMGYNTLQLMAIQEHPFYGSCGYHVSSLFAASSRCGSPEDLKYLIDVAHGAGLIVILDIVHSHISTNTADGLAGFDLGQEERLNYFRQGEGGYHKEWDSKLLNYRNREVLRLLLSNLRWWVEEYRFDGFRFDGVTSMLYHHHGISHHFTGHYGEYFSTSTDVDAVVYLMLANRLVHELLPDGVMIAEDFSGMPTLCIPVDKGGIGFDYRMAMGIPDFWVRTVKEYDDGQWSLDAIIETLLNRRRDEKTVAYVECHDQSIMGDKTLAFRLLGQEMWTNMSVLKPMSPNISRGLALHKVIRAITFALGGDAWLNFMGNEFGHPDWIDFPRDGNGWSHDRCRRMWSLFKKSHLRYRHLATWDKALMQLEKTYSFLNTSASISTSIIRSSRVVIIERHPLLFVFNFSPTMHHSDIPIGVHHPWSYQLLLDSDWTEFDGHMCFETHSGVLAAVPAHVYDPSRPYCLRLSISARSCIVLLALS